MKLGQFLKEEMAPLWAAHCTKNFSQSTPMPKWLFLGKETQAAQNLHEDRVSAEEKGPNETVKRKFLTQNSLGFSPRFWSQYYPRDGICLSL